MPVMQGVQEEFGASGFFLGGGKVFQAAFSRGVSDLAGTAFPAGLLDDEVPEPGILFGFSTGDTKAIADRPLVRAVLYPHGGTQGILGQYSIVLAKVDDRTVRIAAEIHGLGLPFPGLPDMLQESLFGNRLVCLSIHRADMRILPARSGACG